MLNVTSAHVDECMQGLVHGALRRKASALLQEALMDAWVRAQGVCGGEQRVMLKGGEGEGTAVQGSE